jgi:type IV pilus assembly protein PilB
MSDQERPETPAADDGSTRRSRRKRLGEMLCDHGIITRQQLEDVLALQKKDKGARLGRLLVDLGHATETQICEAVAEQLRIPAADLVAVDVVPAVLNLVPKDLAIKHVCLPWFVEGRDLYLIMADPTNVVAADAIAFRTGLKVKPVVAPESEIILALQKFYAAEENSLALFEDANLADQLSVVVDTESDQPGEEDTEAAVTGAPLVKLVNAILTDAIRAGASDIHIEPQEKGLNLRYRVDGLLRQVMTMPKRVQNKVVSRIKITAHMDISERRKPQDGRTRIIVAGKAFDLRVSTLPTTDGEKVVIRILVQDRAQVALEQLGFDPEVLASFKELLRRPQGMILVTGPTGSGKTSTLYAALNFLRHETTNIVTVEDPVEYKLSGINQVAVSDKSGMTFAAGLRSILRQDPNVVMVGEIRDAETAQIAFQAAQTGHLVLSTLHTNDAPSAVTRLVEMGMPAYLVASSLIAVQAQRLVRRLCQCKIAQPDGSAKPKGCEECRGSGYRGRIAIYELLKVSPRVRSVVIARGSDDLLRRAARTAGMRSMYMDGQAKAARGLTTIEEVLRVVPPDDADDSEDALAGAEEPTSSSPAPPRLARLPEALSSEVRRARRTRVLVVEDDPAMLDALRDLLMNDGYEVSIAGSGEEARGKLYEAMPDLILTDLHMPGMDGLQLLEKVRGDLSTRHIPVVFLSGIGSVDTQIQAFNLGADDYISKPIEDRLLLGRIRRSLFRAHFLQLG